MKKTEIAGMGVCFLTGIALSYGWENMKSLGPVTEPAILTAGIDNAKPPDRSQTFSPAASALESSKEFSLESVRNSLDQHGNLTESDLLPEARLRCLMFAVPSERMGDVLQLLLEMKNPDNFQGLACALFSHWTELDPLAAVKAAEGAGTFSSQARRGIIKTWLNTDPDAALEHLVTHSTSEDLGCIKESLGYKKGIMSKNKARLVDQVFEKWPDADLK